MEIVDRADRLAADFDDDVAGTQSSGCRGAAFDRMVDAHAAFEREAVEARDAAGKGDVLSR